MRQCLIIYEKIYGKHHSDYTESLHSLASDYASFGNFDKSKELNEECLEINELIVGKHHPDYAFSLSNLAYDYTSLGEHANALELLTQCLDIQEVIYGKFHPDYASTLGILAHNQFNLGHHNLSDRALFDSYKISENLFNSNISGLTNNQKELYKSDLSTKLQILQNYALLRKEDNNELAAKAFENWVNLNGMLSDQTNHLSQEIYQTKDDTLMLLFENWKNNRAQLAIYYELTKEELQKREIDIEAFEEATNLLEANLSRESSTFAETKKSHQIKDITAKLKTGEAYLDIIRLPYFSFDDNQRTDSIQYLIYVINSKGDLKNSLSSIVIPDGNKLDIKALSYYASHTGGKEKDLPDLKSYKNYWAPIANQLEFLNINTIYVSSGGVYSKLNIETFYNPISQKFVSEELDVRVVSNARDFIQQKNAEITEPLKRIASLYGFPNFSSSIDTSHIYSDLIVARDLDQFWVDSLSRGKKSSSIAWNEYGSKEHRYDAYKCRVGCFCLHSKFSFRVAGKTGEFPYSFAYCHTWLFL